MDDEVPETTLHKNLKKINEKKSSPKNTKHYLPGNVMDEALKRINYIFDEFDEVVVSVSGGKDSTVILDLTRKVAEERGRLPLKILWLDQEAEWKATEDIVKKWMYDTDFEPLWFQIPMKITNATSDSEEFLNCWAPEDKNKWVREQDPISYKENIYGTDRFHKLFPAIMQKHFGDKKVATMVGMRAEESPKRALALTGSLAYKHITWGRKLNKTHINFFPIYDWSFTDVWKYIHDNKLEYNKIYDEMFRLGESVHNMRVSNLHHETAVNSLFIMQELEPETHNKLVGRIGGINTASSMGADNYYPKKVPIMFKGWLDYRNFLLSKLVINEEHKLGFMKSFFETDLNYEHETESRYNLALRINVKMILANDWEGTSILKDLKFRPGMGDVHEHRYMYYKKIDYLKEIGIYEELIKMGVVKK